MRAIQMNAVSAHQAKEERRPSHVPYFETWDRAVEYGLKRGSCKVPELIQDLGLFVPGELA